MSYPLPPQIIKVKRPRTEDPVDILRVESKRPRGNNNYVFSLQATPHPSSSKSVPRGFRPVKDLPHSFSAPSINSLNANTPSASLPGTPADSLPQNGAATKDNVTPTSSIDTSQTPSKVIQQRRFHISRRSTSLSSSGPLAGNTRKRKIEPTVFVERRVRPRTPETAADKNVDQLSSSEPIRAQKKPGLAARKLVPVEKAPAAKVSSQAPIQRVQMPSGKLIPWDTSSETLAAEMEAYTLQEIGKNLARMEAERPTPTPRARNSTPSKFKPKKPALRYAERHPEVKNEMAMDVDEEMMETEELDDSDYIIDTYIRMPAEALAATPSPKNIGLLIIESQPDIDEFYRENEESEDEEEDDDEDENAEDHYTADYPEDEVDSDDEYNRNAYNYRTGNASDLEEYDEYDAVYHSGDEDSLKYPWAKHQPDWLKPRKRTADDEDEDDEDDI